MFHLAPVRLWRNISIVMAVAAGIAALAGTFFADGSIAVHWSGSGEPNDSAGKWVLWVMLLLTVLSLFTYSSFLKRRPGFQDANRKRNGMRYVGRAGIHVFTY